MAAVDFLKFLVGMFVFVYAPGRAVLDLLRIRRPGLASAILVPAAGMAASTFVNKYARLLHAEFLFFAAAAAAVLYVLWRGIRRIRGLSKKRLSFSRTTAALMVCFLFLAAMLWIDGYGNGIARADGTRVVRMHYYDGFIRTAVIGELAHSVPPEMPFAAGTPLGYHYGMDLFLSLFVRYLGLDVFDLVFRLGATFFWGMLLLAVFLFARTLFGNDRTGVIATFLVLFGGGGWTWLATLARGTPLGGNPFYALYVFDGLGVNSLVPGFALAFCGLTALTDYLRTKRSADLVLFALLLSAAVEFKVFLGPPLLGALFVCGLAARRFVGDEALLRASGVFAAALAPLGIAAFAAAGSAGPAYRYALKFIDWPGRVLADLRLDQWLGLWNGAVYDGRLTAAGVGAAAAAVALTLFGALGPGVIAVPRLIRDFFTGPKNGPRFFTSGLAAACFLYFFLFEIKLGPLDRTILNAYVHYFGLMLVLIYAADVLARAAKNRSKAGGLVLPALVLALTLPNTALFLQQKLRTPETRIFSAPFLEACRWLGKNAPPEAVILHWPQVRYVCHFSGRRVVLDDSVNSYLDFHLSREEISRRRDLANRFFADPQKWPEALEAFGVTHVLRLNKRPFPEDAEGNAALDATRLRRVFRNGEFTIYRVERN